MEFVAEIYLQLYEKDFIKDKKNINLELEKGNFSLSKLFLKVFCQASILSEHAAMSGRIQILKWLKTSCGEYKTRYCWYEICSAAVHKGRFQTLKWLRIRNEKYNTPAPWDVTTINTAIKSENFQILKWLRNHEEKYGPPCPWNTHSYNYTTNKEIKRWMIENGCPRE